MMHSSPGDAPESEQIWSAPETLSALQKFVNIHLALVDYKRYLMFESQFYGLPVLRPLMLHYPLDPVVAGITDQFLMGENILVAPVFSPTVMIDGFDETERDVYLPGP
jgi:alpha-glucosidase